MGFERHCLFATFFILIALAGCQSATVRQPIVARLNGNDPDRQLEFWHTLAAEPLASNDDAFHGLLLYFDGKDDAGDYAARVGTLRARGMLPPNFKRPAAEAINRGKLAVALAKALDFKGGLTMRLLGASPRLALKELEFRNLLPPSSENQALTGAEFFGIIGKVHDYRTGNPADYPPQMLPGEIPGAKVAANVGSQDEVAASTNPILATVLIDPASAPSTGPTEGQLTATVAKVEGFARARPRPNEPWQFLKIGDRVAVDSVIQTGPFGGVVLIIPPDQILTFDRASEGTILEAIKSGGKITTNIGLKFGRARYGISAAGVEHESTIRTPNSTLAVRGTVVSVFDQAPFPPEAVSLTGRAQYSVFKRESVAVGSASGGKAKVRADTGSAAQTALSSSVVDPFLAAARSEAEAPLVASVISRGGVITFDTNAGIPVVRGGGVPSNADLLRTLPGQLNLVVRWNTNANVDLAVSTPDGDFLYPIGEFAQGKGGGVIPFDHRGGKGGGFEIAYFPIGKIPAGTYAVSATEISGQPTTLLLEAYFNKRRLALDPTAESPQFQETANVSKGFGLTDFIFLPDPNNPTLESTPTASRQTRSRGTNRTAPPAAVLPKKK